MCNNEDGFQRSSGFRATRTSFCSEKYMRTVPGPAQCPFLRAYHSLYLSLSLSLSLSLYIGGWGVDSSGALLCLLPDVPNLVHVDSNLFGVRWGGVDWGERENALRGEPLLPLPSPKKAHDEKKHERLPKRHLGPCSFHRVCRRRALLQADRGPHKSASFAIQKIGIATRPVQLVAFPMIIMLAR